jgi:hypothetical protein
MREYADRAPEDGVDVDRLRDTLAGMNEDARLRFMELLIEALIGEGRNWRERHG